MSKQTNDQNVRFLSGGGEMGELMRAKDWSKTPVGDPETWPQSLRTTLSIILNSKFPMFIWWGPDLICFYNDAYRPSLGQEGKHPSILGMKAEEAWPEIWDIIKPLIDQVLAGGEATWSEDQLIPIYRNGRLEDVYWTFSYSSVNDESGMPAGVLVTCNETTDKINSLKKLETSNKRYLANIMQAPVAMSIFRGKEHVVEIANKKMLELWGKKMADVMHRPIFEGLPEAKGQGLEQLLDSVFETGESFAANERLITLPRNGRVVPTYINFVYEALKEPDGNISGIVAIASDVTLQVVARQKIEESEKRFRDIVQQAPLGITIFRGPEFVVEMANETYLQIVDRKEKEFIGRPLFESLPEVKEIVGPLLTNVLVSGIPFHATDFGVTLNRYGKAEDSYFNLVYHPLKEDNGDITGIIVIATEVTASVKAKHALGESEKQFRNLVMQSPIPMTIFRGKDYIIELANTEMYNKIWRKKESEVVGKKALDVFPELRDQKYPELLANVYTSGKTHRENESLAYVQGDDGLKKFYLDYEYSPLLDTNNSIFGIMITVNDVTEKVEARKRLEESQERLNIVIEASELATWELNLETKELYYSDKYLDMMGYEKGVVLKHTQVLEQLHPDDTPVREKAFNDAYNTGLLHYVSRIRWKDESLHWIEARGKVFYDDAGKPLKMIGTLRDITDEKNYHDQMQKREQKFRLLADSMPQFVWTSDVEGNLNYFNLSVYNYSGLSEQQIREDGWIGIIHPDDREENIKRWLQSIESGEDFIFEHRFRRADGMYRWQLSRAIAQRDAAGKIQMWVGTSTDIQDQKMFTRELEKQVLERTRQLEQKNKELEKMNSELQSFAYVSSHDLQEPLRKIQTFASRLLEKEKANLSDTAKDYFARIQDAANRMQTLIEDLLAYSRTNSTERVFKKVNLNEVIIEVKNELKEVIAEKNAVIEVGQMCEATIIPFQFRQLLSNLISNSLKFSKEGIPPCIKIKCETVPGEALKNPALSPKKLYCHLSLSDNGIGFDPEYNTRIFEIFQRLHGRDEYKGTGIGLAIVKKIVENHNGLITATGQPGEGASFDIYVPA